jgi:hypothetical protein
VKYELGFYIPEDDILHSHRRENLKSYIDTLVETRCADQATALCPQNLALTWPTVDGRHGFFFDRFLQ